MAGSATEARRPLEQGNEIRVADITAHLEPDSVILRDPTGEHALQILEQNYSASATRVRGMPRRREQPYESNR